MSFDGLLLLPADVRVVPVRELDAGVRAHIEAADQDCTITRARSRMPTSIVNADSAELLASFRRPARIVDAVIEFARRRGRDPHSTLDAAYPVLRRLYRMRVLVPAFGEGNEPIEAGLQVGDTFAGLRLLRRVREMDDNEVYLARGGDGRHAAVKFYRNANARVARGLVREARLLRRIAGGRVPAVFGLSRAGSGFGLAVEWICGVEAQEAAAPLQGMDSERDEHALLSLCIEVTAAFAQLHGQGVVHGDVHPGNVLVEARGSVRLIDFGMARDVGRVRADDVRGGVPFYYEPEFADALRQGRTLPPSVAGEQYAVGALLYQLWTGVHYLDCSLERDQMLRQIVEDDPQTFEACRVPPWPALEQVLRRALHKTPRQRFPNVAMLAAALRELLPHAQERDRQRASTTAPAPAEAELLDRVLDRFTLRRPASAESGLASIDCGTAGIAYALLRIAQHRGDPRLLASADLWAQKSYALSGRDGAFCSAERGIEAATVGEISLFHSASGLHCVRALVSAAQGDAVGANAALGAFVEHTRRPCGCEQPFAHIDLALGKAGLLLGCAELIESIPSLPVFELGAVRARGEQIAGEVLAQVGSGPIERSEMTTLGMAHGWGGLLFSLLRWSRAIDRDPPPVIAERLLELAALGEPSGAGRRWPVQAMGASFMDGWCNGSAGYAMLFALACGVLEQPELGRVAESAALSAWSSPTRDGSLCCGQAGIGFALLALHRLSGDDVWLKRAGTAARRAAGAGSRHLPDGELYRGALGVALLAADLKRADGSAMPLVEPKD